MIDPGERRPLILHVINALRIGGLENGLVNLVNRTDPEKYRHGIVCLDSYDDFALRIRRPDVALYSMHRKPGQDLGMYLRLFRLLRRLKPALVHTRNLATIETQLVAFLAGARARVHGEHGWTIQDPRGEVKKYQYLRRALRPFVHQFIALSGEIEIYLRDRIRVPAARIERIVNGVDLERFSERQPAAVFPDFPPGAVVVGAVGRLDAVKDPMNLVQAFVRVLAQRPELRDRLRLVWIGDGGERAAMDAALREADAAQLAWLPGGRDDVPALLAGFDLYVLPSRAEGISNTLLEAMASGLPVVATDVGGNRELLGDGEAACLVPPGDPEALARAISSYVLDPARRRSHGQANATRCRARFSIQHMVDRYSAVYDRLLGVHGA